MSDLASYQMKQASAAVQQIPADAFLNKPTEDIVSDLTEKHSFTPPTLRRADAYIDGPHEMEIRLPDYGREVRLRGTLLALIVPFDGQSMFYMNPGRWGGAIRGNLHNNNLILTIRGDNLQTAQVNEQFNVRINEIEEYLGYQRTIAAAHRQSLPLRLRPEIEARKQKLLDARKMVAGLAFPIRARPDAPKTFVAPVVRRTIPATAPRKITEPFAPEPVLDDANYEHILGVIDNMAHVMERSPSAFVGSGEEALRQHFLVQLNGHYQGAATGETFNFTGKTDILIRVNGKNIFIAECKFWAGEKVFTETIDQLLGYLSWRDTKASVIIFNRNRNFSAVLQTVQEAVPKHPHLKRVLPKRSETSFRYVFGNPSDHNRELMLTVMVFDIPNETP